MTDYVALRRAMDEATPHTFELGQQVPPSGLCSCGEWQWDTDRNGVEQFTRPFAEHVIGATGLAAVPNLLALLVEARVRLEHYAPRLPHTVHIGVSPRCTECHVPVKTTYGPTHRGIAEWSKDETPHAEGCWYVKSRDLISRLPKDA